MREGMAAMDYGGFQLWMMMVVVVVVVVMMMMMKNGGLMNSGGYLPIESIESS